MEAAVRKCRSGAATQRAAGQSRRCAVGEPVLGQAGRRIWLVCKRDCVCVCARARARRGVGLVCVWIGRPPALRGHVCMCVYALRRL